MHLPIYTASSYIYIYICIYVCIYLYTYLRNDKNTILSFNYTSPQRKELLTECSIIHFQLEGLQPLDYILDMAHKPMELGFTPHVGCQTKPQKVVHPLQPLPLIVGREKVTQTEVKYVERYQFQPLYSNFCWRISIFNFTHAVHKAWHEPHKMEHVVMPLHDSYMIASCITCFKKHNKPTS